MADNFAHILVMKETHAETGQVWEFSCPRCGYRGRFIKYAEPVNPELEILDRGDPEARHMSSQLEALLLDPSNWSEMNEVKSLSEEWFTPEFQDRLEEAVQGMAEIDGYEEIDVFNEEEWLTSEAFEKLEHILQTLDT
jgi:hypothetical protein